MAVGEKASKLLGQYPLSTSKHATSLCCWAGGASGGQHLSPEHVYRMCVLVLHVCTTRRVGEDQDPSLLGQGKAAGDQGWPRATPAAAKCGVQLHLVGSEAPPPVPPRPFGYHTETRLPKSWSLWPCLPCHPLGNRSRRQQPHPGVWASPALRDAGQPQPVDAHAKPAACTQIHLRTLRACAASTRTAGAEPAVPLRPVLCVLRLPCACRRRLNEGSCLPARWKQS